MAWGFKASARPVDRGGGDSKRSFLERGRARVCALPDAATVAHHPSEKLVCGIEHTV
jgi:hypothetical protein